MSSMEKASRLENALNIDGTAKSSVSVTRARITVKEDEDRKMW